MSEGSDYDPGPWQGHDFSSARQHYDTHAGRSYEQARKEKKTIRDLIPDSIEASCVWPLIIITDETDSMQDWPAVMFSKMPYLDKEGQEYLGSDMQTAFMAIGDANSGRRCAASQEDYPLQVRPFAKGLEMAKRIKELVLERKGGGQTRETYELAALYCLHKVKTPRATHKPIIIFIGDEQPYDDIDPENAARLMNIKLEKKLQTADVFRDLRKKYSVYLVRKPYDTSTGDALSPLDRQIFRHWADLIGEEHIAHLPEAQRVVDVIFGILAKETERIAYFEEELAGRQSAEQTKTVFRSLNTIHGQATKGRTAHDGKSIIRGSKPDEEKVKPLV